MKEIKKEADLTTKAGRYFLAKQKAPTKKAAALMVGLSPTHTTRMEKTKSYQAIEAKYKDRLLNVITLDEIALAHAENITQDKDRGARNTAIKMAVDRIEPDILSGDGDEKVLVILRT